MPIIEKTVTLCQCIKCGYEWLPNKKIEDIRQCPNCRTRHWDEPKLAKWQRKEESK